MPGRLEQRRSRASCCRSARFSRMRSERVDSAARRAPSRASTRCMAIQLASLPIYVQRVGSSFCQRHPSYLKAQSSPWRRQLMPGYQCCVSQYRAPQRRQWKWPSSPITRARTYQRAAPQTQHRIEGSAVRRPSPRRIAPGPDTANCEFAADADLDTGDTRPRSLGNSMDPITGWLPYPRVARANLTTLRFGSDISVDWICERAAPVESKRPLNRGTSTGMRTRVK